MTNQNLEKEKKQERSSRRRKTIIIILIIIILLLLSFAGCFAQKLAYKTNLEAQAKDGAKNYIKDYNLQFEGDVSIPIAILKEGNYLDYFDSKCLDSSYVIVRKNNGNLEYEPVIVCDNSKAILKLNGDANKKLEVGDDYIEEGATVEGDTAHEVIIESSVDTSKKGNYGVTYKIPDSDIPPVLRVVEVVDTTKPIITLKNSDILYLSVGDTFVEPGYKAIDNYDGDVTANVKVSGTVNTSKAGSYIITYTVTDSSNNVATVKRQVIVRENVPTINLKGYGTVYVSVFGTYIEEGYTATDTKGNNLTKQVIVSGSVNTSVVGEYVITYKVTGDNGATATIRRIVKVVDNTKPVITLNGDPEITLEWGHDTYVELGASATDNYDGNISNRISITGIFNPNKLGTYYLAYTITDSSGNKATVQRVVKVVDRQRPEITLKGDATIYVEAGNSFNEPGYIATDNHDKKVDVTIKGFVNTNVLGKYTLTYIATDASGNKSEATRDVVVRDTTAPVITLKGDAITYVELGSSYVEPGYTATDNYDRFVNNKVVVNGSVLTDTIGTYYITYNVTDSNNNAALEVVRTIIVRDTTAPVVKFDTNDLFGEGNFVKNVSVKMNAIDKHNGLSSIRYAWSNVEPTDYAELTDYVEGTDYEFSFDQNGTYYLWIEATDKAGNVTKTKVGPFKIDNVEPTVSFTPNGSIGQNASVIPNVKDNFSGVKEVYYAWSTSNTTEPTEFTKYTNGSLTKDVDGTYYLWIKAVDNASNEIVTVSNAFVVDNAYPSITFSYPSNSNVVKVAVVDVLAMGNSGKTITKVEYMWTTSNVRPEAGYTEWTDYESNHTITMPDNLDGDYYLWIKATDSYGLVSYNSSRMITIDNTLPVITVTPNGNTLSIKNIDVKIDVVEDNVDTILWAISQDSDINNVTLNNSLTDLNSTISLEGLDGTYYLHVAVTDKAGNYQDYTSLEFNFDNTAPVNPEIIYDENWTNQDITVTINGTDNIEYSFDNENWLVYDETNKPVVSQNTKIYAKASDVAGNISETVSKDITNIDKVLPSLDLEFEEGVFNKLEVSYKAADSNSGIASIYYAWSNSDTVEPVFDETNVLTSENGKVSKADVSGDYALWIKVVDNAGNVTIKHTTLLSLDKEAPVINIISGNGSLGPVTSMDTSVSITDNTDLTIEYIYSNSNTELDDSENWTSWYNYSDINNTLTINDRYTDGIYYLHIKATDEAGNVSHVISNAFKLVNAKPEVNYDPATSLDYKLEVSTNVSATLNNATIKGMYYAWSTSTNASDITSWTEFNNGDKISKNDATGEYYLYIKVVDDVDGNRETIVKSTGTFNIDKTNVNVSFDPNGTKTPVKEVETEIIASDDHSGINTIKYAWGTSNLVSPDLREFVDYKLGTTITKTTENTFETYYLWVYAKDEAGNENYTVSSAFIIDNSYPVIDLDPNRSNPVNDLSVNVTISVDENKTLTNIYYAWDTNSEATDNTVWTEWNIADYEKDHVLTQTGLNGIYYLHIKVVDNNGLEAVKSTYALEFDNIAPVVGINPGELTTPVQSVKPVITVTETNDYNVSYSFTTEADPKLATYTEWNDFMGQGKDTLTLGDSSTNGTYYLHVKVVDEALNTTIKTVVYEFDNVAPEAPSIDYDDAWTNDRVEITINGGDATDSYEYSFDGENWLAYDATNKPVVTVNNTTIYARSKDVAGNISDVTEATVTNIDKVAPEFTLIPNTTEWTNKDVIMSVNVTNDNLSPIVDVRWAPIALTVEDYRNGRGFNVSLDTLRFGQGINREYIEVYVRDAAGNETIVSTSVTNIDKELPVITVDPDTVTIDEDTVYDIFSGVSATDNVGFGENELTATEFSSANPGTYTITYTITDIAGNVGTATRTIIVLDKTAPTLDLTYSDTISKELSVSYVTSDEYSGVANIYYAWSTSDIIEPIFDEANVLTDLTGTIVKNDGDGKYVLWVKAVDNAGNEVVKHTTILTIDNTAPVVTITPDASENPIKNISPIVNVVEANGYKVYYSFTTEANAENATYTEWMGFVGDGTDTKVFGDDTTNGTYYVHIKVVDEASNEAYATASYVFDNEDPVITVSPVDVVIAEGAEYDVLTGVSVNDNIGIGENEITFVTDFDYTTPGVYTVTYTVSDKAGNIGTATRTIKVLDTTAPVITIIGKDNIEIEVGSDYIDEGVNAFDTVDGDVTDNVITNITLNGNKVSKVDTNVLGTYLISYTVSDAEGNEADVVIRTVKVVDTTAPELDLVGDDEVTISLGNGYNELGYTVSDNYDKNVNVDVDSNLVITKVGKYTITYTATDSSNNTVSITRTVYVVANALENIFRDSNSCEDGTDCFSTPDAVDNYFWYSGYLFRAYKSNKDGSIKLVTEGSIASLSYDDASSIFAGSVVENWLNDTFYNSLNNPDQFLATSNWCNLNTNDANNNRTTCSLSSVSEAKVGLLTLFEYNLVGGKNSYLNNGDRFFTITRYGTKSVWAIGPDGTPISGEMVVNVDAIRPVITLAAGIEAVEGDGTKTNPYRLANDTAASANTSLNDRYTGEYVKFNDQTWRIVSTDENGTKLILDSYLQNANGEVIEAAYGDSVHYGMSNIVTEISNYYQNNDKLLNTVWYRGTYAWGENPMGTSIRLDGNYSNHKYGLIRIGELMSGRGATLEMNGMTYWTMTENDDNTVWHITTTGGAAYDNLSAPRAIRPVIKLDSNMTIVSGTGIYNNPYVIK